MIIVDSLEQAPGALLSLEGTSQDVLREDCASLEDGISVGGPPSADNVVGEVPSVETVVVPLLFARQLNLVIRGPHRPRGHDRLVLNSQVKPIKWDHPPVDAFALGPNVAQSIINRWNPFNQRDTSIADMG